jgi:hypothetical protein
MPPTTVPVAEQFMSMRCWQTASRRFYVDHTAPTSPTPAEPGLRPVEQRDQVDILRLLQQIGALPGGAAGRQYNRH